jgi:Na+/H+ antiporter NhaA
VVATLAALLWANLPGDTYRSAWETRLAISLGDHSIATDLRGWVNEGLMTLFFLVVGLEAKRELDLGELRERSRVAIPVMAGAPRSRPTRRSRSVSCRCSRGARRSGCACSC